MFNFRMAVLAAALAARALPACADPVQDAGPGAGHVQQEQTHGADADAAGNDVPEPASLALIGLGVLGLIAFRRKV